MVIYVANMKEYAMMNDVSVYVISNAVKSGKITPFRKKGKEILFDASIPLMDYDDFLPLYTSVEDIPKEYVTRLKNIFKCMRTRCYNTKVDNYIYYGAKGVKICDEWLNDRDAFIIWSVNHGYEDDLSIDRIDSDGDYCPQNCKWVTKSKNSSNAASVEIDKEILIRVSDATIKQSAEKQRTLRKRGIKQLQS